MNVNVRRLIATLLAGLAVTLGVVVLTGVVVVRRELVQDHFYNNALVHNDVYDRVYGEVLTDHELTNVTEQLVGNLHVGRVDPAEARILTTNALHLVLPPSTLRLAVEQFLAEVLAYIRGDTDRLGGEVDVHAVVANIQTAAVPYARAVLAAVRPDAIADLAKYRSAVREFEAALTTGAIPSSVPVPTAALPAAQVAAVLLGAAGPHVSKPVATLIEGAVGDGDARDALITEMTPLVTTAAKAAASAVGRALVGGRDFDAVDALAQHAHTTQSRIGASLDPARRAVSWFGPLAIALGVVLLLGGIGGLFVVYRARPAQGLAVLAVALVIAGLAVNVLWFAARHGVAPPLGAATRTGAGSWNLPNGLRHVVRDVEGTLRDELQRQVWRISLVPIGAGAAIVVGLAIARLSRYQTTRTGVIVGAATAVLLVAVVVVMVIVVIPHDRSARECNLHVELCERPYNEVTQAATHNAMSSPDVVQFWPEQDLTIRQQLDLGVRTLLLDVHYWRGISSPDELTQVEPALPTAVARLFMSIDPARFRPREGLYLCHVLCAFGGIPLEDGLTQIRSFLADNPNEVVTLIIQDEVESTDVVRALETDGLAKYAYSHASHQSWPTLGQLIDRNEHLVVFAENSGPPPAWYQAAFDGIVDTPFDFPNPGAMTCAENRGASGASLFLINHWVSGPIPDRATALQINQTDAVVERARRCARERGRSPTFVAVDFAGLGGVVQAVDVLNGVDH